MFRLHSLLPLCLLTLPAFGQANSNDVPLNNGGDVMFIFSSPSIGAPSGTVPPDSTGDLYYKVLPGDRLLRHATPASVVIDGYYESIFDSNFSTSPDFYDRTHGPAVIGASSTFEPAFFQLGFTSEVTVILGSSGFGNPCTVAPSLCSPPGGTCPPPGFVNGFLVDIDFGAAGIGVPADGTSASDLATTYFLPGGMTATGGACGLGDYTFQDVHSTDESAADVLGTGLNPFGGFQFSGSGPLPESIVSSLEANLTFRNPMLNPIADSGTGFGLEEGDNGGGAANGLLLPVGSGSATLGVEIRSLQSAGVPNLAVAGASLAPLPAPGIDVFGASLLVTPDTAFRITSGVWQGAVLPMTFVFTSEGAFQSAQLPLPSSVAGFDLFLQGFVLDLTSFAGENTNVVRTSLLP